MGERLVLVGAGHAHLHLIVHADRLLAAGYRVTLVAPRWFHYSGTAAAVATGRLDPRAGRVDVRRLAAGLDVVEGEVERVDLAGRRVVLRDGGTVTWDVLAVNVGSVASPAPVAEALTVKPLTTLAGLRERLAGLPPDAAVTVVGAGPSGVELAGQLARGHAVRVTLVDRAGLLPGAPEAARRRLARVLRRRGVRLLVDQAVTGAAPDHVRLEDGTVVSHDLIVWASGLVPAPLARQAGLGGDDGIPVRATLQHRDHDDVYATGDCAHFLPGPLPRIGVHGVRQGPVLLASLEARRSGAPLPTYRPQRVALSILDLGDLALAIRGRRWWLGRSARWLKRRIDRRWLAPLQR